MKTKLLLFCILISFSSCVQQNTPVLSDAEKKSIESEVNLMIDSMLSACGNLTADKAMSYYENSPEFKLVGMDGSVSDYNSTYQANKDFFGSCVSANFQTLSKNNIILNDKLVLQTLIYNATVTTNSNEKITFEKIGATSLIKKTGNKWKIVYFHESSLPPKTDSIKN